VRKKFYIICKPCAPRSGACCCHIFIWMEENPKEYIIYSIVKIGTEHLKFSINRVRWKAFFSSQAGVRILNLKLIILCEYRPGFWSTLYASACKTFISRGFVQNHCIIFVELQDWDGKCRLIDCGIWWLFLPLTP